MERRATVLLIILAACGVLLDAQELYFEEPRTFAGEYRLFPRVDATEDRLVVAYQEVVSRSGEGGAFQITVEETHDGLSWGAPRRVGVRFPFEGTQIPPVFDLAVSPADGSTLIALVDEDGVTRIRRRAVDAAEWEAVTLAEGETDERVLTEITTTSAPRLFHRSGGGFLLFVTRFVEPNIRLLYSTSDDGRDWSPLRLLPAELAVGNLTNPTVASRGGVDVLVVEGSNPFAEEETGVPTTYQLYTAVSTDGGLTWPTITPERRITPEANTDNRLPELRVMGEELVLLWVSGQIYRVELGEDARMLTQPRQITDERAPVGRIKLIMHPTGPLIIGQITRAGRPSVALFMENGRYRQSQIISGDGAASFLDAAVFRERLHTFWQQREENALTAPARIVYMEPDQRAAPPSIRAVNFAVGERNRLDTPAVTWSPAPDPSGVAGYSLTWSQDPDAPVPRARDYDEDTTRVTLEADADGLWYARIRTVDNAGNWSAPATLSFFRDTTPPGLVRFVPPQVDEDGYLASNSFTLEWRDPGDDEVAGYSYEFRYIGGEREAVSIQVADSVEPPRRITTTQTSVSRQNADDGLWALAVRAVDVVGNVGEAATLLVRTNKYVPSTQIWTIATDQDPLERYNVEIIGRGFTANGIIRTLIVDRDQREPYDYVYTMGENDFQVDGNGNIVGPILDDLETGVYFIGVLHPERGVYFAPQRLSFERNGTIKFGDFTIRYAPEYEYAPPAFASLSSVSALVWVVLALLAAVAMFSGTRVVGIAREGRFLTLEARALIAGRSLPALTYRERMQQMKRRGVGLRLKFTFFVVVLVVAIVSMLAVGLGTVTLSNQREILAQGLQDRVDVLIGSIASGAVPLMQDTEDSEGNTADNASRIDDLTGQTAQMREARYATITGQSILSLDPEAVGPEEIALIRSGEDAETTAFDFVWGTNDPVIENAGRSQAEQEEWSGIERKAVPGDRLFTAGATRVVDPVSGVILDLETEINRRVTQALGDLPDQIAQARADAQAVGALFFDEQVTRAEWEQAIDNVQVLNRRASEAITEITSEVSSYPEFSVEEFDRNQLDYVFYRPLGFLDPDAIGTGDPQYFRGLVRMGVSTDLIVQQIDAAREAIIRITVIIAAAAIGAGIVGALLLATVVVIPIQKLVRGVEKIRDTEDKEDLKGESIQVRSKDELAVLAETINSMTRGLAEAAAASKMLTMGKGTQKMFVPLDKNPDTNEKETTASEDMPYAEFFGYYEGAKGVSGDYFAYEKLDDEHYAVIKSDAAGKGVPAALIMVQVATLFISYFRGWSAKKDGFDLTGLVATINDLVAEREFVGLFATLMILIVNTRTGQVHVSHAGDNKLHWLNHRSQTLETFEMDRMPPAGSFAGIPYKQYSLSVTSGDTLMLFTDGLEEAQRVFRDRDYSQLSIEEVQRRLSEAGFTEEEIDEAVAKGKNEGDTEVTEEFMVARRIKPIAEAVKRGGTFELERLLNPNPQESLTFDFHGVAPTAQNIVYALISVEKIFRVYPDPNATAEDRVQVDKKIDAFLKAHFTQYNRYFREDRRLPEDPRSAYVWYTHLKEDEQYDDLTILAMRKK